MENFKEYYTNKLTEIITLAEEAKEDKTYGKAYDHAYEILRLCEHIQAEIDEIVYSDKDGKYHYGKRM